MLSYDDKSATYFANARVEIEPLLGPVVDSALEVGCGGGHTMRWLKASGHVRSAWGMELFESAAASAREHFQEVIAGDAEALLPRAFPGMSFDLILCLDVLEHMLDPWTFVARLQERLAPGGKLVISVPNVRCTRVLLPLILKGWWRYADEGILDRTHLRFFTRESALALAATGALRVEQCLEHRPRNSRLDKLDRWTFNRFGGFTTFQYLIASTRGD